MRISAVLGAVMGLAMGLAGGAGAETWKGYEMPPYRVETVDGVHEVRAYAAHRVAEVRTDRAGSGFRVLAGYIFGANAEGRKMAMTVPVTQVPSGQESWTMRFLMPAGEVKAGLPVPRDARVTFADVPPGRQVVERFSGWAGDAAMAEHARSLRVWAEGKGLKLADGPFFYFYDAPMTLPWNRRNEVAFTLR